MKPIQITDLSKSLMNHVVLLSALLVTGLLLSACKQEQSASAGKDITGVYSLTAVDGKSVPATISHDNSVLQVRSGSFTVSGDGSCSSKTTFVPPNGAETTREVKATYTKEGPKLTMKWEGAGTTTATIEGGTLTLNNEGMLLVYKK